MMVRFSCIVVVIILKYSFFYVLSPLSLSLFPSLLVVLIARPRQPSIVHLGTFIILKTHFCKMSTIICKIINNILSQQQQPQQHEAGGVGG